MKLVRAPPVNLLGTISQSLDLPFRANLRAVNRKAKQRNVGFVSRDAKDAAFPLNNIRIVWHVAP